jgi:hypothetical protein
MSFDRSACRSPLDEEVRVDQRPTVPPPPRPSGLRVRAVPALVLDPLEEALIARPLWDSREPEPAIHEILYRFSVGDAVGAIAAADLLLDGRRAPALTVSVDVLDELDLDHRAAVFLANVDGTTPLSRVLVDSGLDLDQGVRTVCELVERRIIVLRSVSRPR